MRLVGAVAVAVLLAAGCSDDGDGGDDGAAVGTEPTGSTVTVAPADAGFCDAFGALIAGPLTDGSVDLQDPANLEVVVAATRSILSSLVAAAPAELAADAGALAAEYDAGFDVLARYGYDFARVGAEATPEDAAVLDSFLAAPAGPDVADPLARLEDAFLERCAAGVTVPPELLTTTTAP